MHHALRAFTPKDQKAVRTVAGTFRENPSLNTADVITELGVGEALVSTLAAEGLPTQVERVLVRPPESQIGPMSGDERKEHMARSPFKGRYDTTLDRESAYEMLIARAKQNAAKEAEIEAEELRREAEEKMAKSSSRRSSSRRQTTSEAFMKSAARAIGTQLGRRVLRGVLGSLFKS